MKRGEEPGAPDDGERSPITLERAIDEAAEKDLFGERREKTDEGEGERAAWGGDEGGDRRLARRRDPVEELPCKEAEEDPRGDGESVAKRARRETSCRGDERDERRGPQLSGALDRERDRDLSGDHKKRFSHHLKRRITRDGKDGVDEGEANG